MNLIKDKPQISHKEYRNMFVRIETEMKRYNCPHKHILFGEVCLDCGKDMWG